MQDLIPNSLLTMFDGVTQILIFGFGSVLLILAGFFAIKGLWRLRGNSAYTSYQQGVVAPLQYGERGSKPEDAFATRLEHLVEEEEAYELSRLMPKARELGAIARTKFETTPVLVDEDVGVLALIEDVVRELDGGFRVLVNTSLESVVNLDGLDSTSIASKVSMTGVKLKFAVVDRFGRLVVAVEHMDGVPLGRQGNINRTVVIEVLRKAGVWYLEIPHHYSGKNARAQLMAVLRGKAASFENEEEAEGVAEAG